MLPVGSREENGGRGAKEKACPTHEYNDEEKKRITEMYEANYRHVDSYVELINNHLDEVVENGRKLYRKLDQVHIKQHVDMIDRVKSQKELSPDELKKKASCERVLLAYQHLKRSWLEQQMCYNEKMYCD